MTRRLWIPLSLAGWLAGQPAPPTGEPLAGGVVAEICARLKVPGLSVAVVRDGKIVWARGYGVKRAGGTDAVTASTLFQAASISKPVAALAALHLSQYGHFGLDEDVNAKLTSWKVKPHASGKPVTLRGILSHSAGLTVHGFRGYAVGEPVPTLVQILDGVPPANSGAVVVDLEPGTKWRYSGGGYTVLQQLMVDRMKLPFPEILRMTVLRPAGMTHSTYEQPLPAGRAAEAAAGHDRQGQPIPGGWHTYPEMAAAGLWTTPTDLAHLIIAVQRTLRGQFNQIIERDAAERMLTIQSDRYGLGFAVEGAGRSLRFSHGGSNEGYKCRLMGSRDHGLVVMTNGDQGARAVQEIVALLERQYPWQ